MSRSIYRLIVVLAGVFASGVIAQSSEVVLHLLYEVTGEKRALLCLPSSVEDRFAFAGAVAAVLGIDELAVTEGADPAISKSDIGLHGTGRVPERRGLTFADQLDLNDFHVPLVAAGFNSMRLVVRLPDAPQSALDLRDGSVFLGGVLYSDLIEADQLGAIRHVQYGWRPLDIALYVSKLLLPLFLIGVVFQKLLRRRLGVTGPEHRNADFAFLRRLSHAHVMFCILWFFYVALWLPLRFPAYSFPSLASHTLALTFVLAWLTGAALSVWAGGKLHQLTQHHLDTTWTRRDLALCGLANCTFEFATIQFFANPAIVAFSQAAGNPSPSALLVLCLLLPFLLWAGHYSTRFLGIEPRVAETGVVYDRLHALAAEIGVKRPPRVLLVHFTRGYLAAAFSFSLLLGLKNPLFASVLSLDARLLRDIGTKELDTVLACSLFRMKIGSENRLGLLLIFYILFACAAVLGASILVIELDLWGVGTTWSVVPIFALSLLSSGLVGVLGWLHYSWAARRYMRREDDSVLALLKTPEQQIRGILHSAVLCRRPLESDRWWWLRGDVAPLERARRLNVIDEGEIQKLQKEAEDISTDMGAEQAPSATLDLSGALNTQVMISMAATIPLWIAGPVVMGTVYQQFLVGIVPSWFAVSLGSILCTVVNFIVANRLDQVGYWALASALSRRAAKSGESTRYPVLYRTGPRRHSLSKSVGVLQVGDGGMVYHGDDTQLEIPWGQVRSISLTYFGLLNIPALEACATWVDSESGEFQESRFTALCRGTQIGANETTLRIVTALECARRFHGSRYGHGDTLRSDVRDGELSRVPSRIRVWARLADVVFLGLIGVLFLVLFTGVFSLAFARYTSTPTGSAWSAVAILLGHLAIGSMVSFAYRPWMALRLRRSLRNVEIST